MGFWNLSDGKAVESKSEFELGGGFEVIPDGSRVLAAVEECKDDQWEGERFFNLKWRILEGEYKNRIIFQKLKVFSSKEKQRDNAITMLANRPMILLLRVWESEDKQKTGNYVAGVFSRQQTKAAPAPKQSAPFNEQTMDFSDDVPF
jgi:hypothetical protein